MNIEWEGIYPAVTTKFTASDALDIPLMEKNLAAQLSAGVSGIVLGGTLGEASSLREEERLQLLRSVLDYVADRVPVVLNIAERTTRDALRAVKQAESQGAHGFMLLPPMRYKADDRETLAYIEEIARATSLPIMLYNNPVDYRIEITLDMFEALSKYSHIQAVKESTRDISNIVRMRRRFGDRFKILSGVDTLALESLLMGADGWVAGLVCAFPAETVTIYRLVRAERYEEARALYQWFFPLLELDISTKLVQNIKLAEVATGLGSEQVRPPRLPLAGKERARVQAIIDEALQTRPVLPQLEEQVQDASNE